MPSGNRYRLLFCTVRCELLLGFAAAARLLVLTELFFFGLNLDLERTGGCAFLAR